MGTEIEAETVLQPSLHGLEEWVDMVISEAECRAVDVSALRSEFDNITSAGEDDERYAFLHELADEIGEVNDNWYFWGFWIWQNDCC